MSGATPIPKLVVRTFDAAFNDDLIDHASPDNPLVWSRGGDGMVGVGVAARLPESSDMSHRWAELAAAATVTDEVGVAGTGLIGFGAFSFAATDAVGGIVVPRVIWGRRDGRRWTTVIHPASEPEPVPEPPMPPGDAWSATLGPGAMDPAAYETAVAKALDVVAAGEVSKVVLARDLTGTIPAGADLRRLVWALASGYPDTWTFAVEGLIGASPETLVTVSGGVLTARVLAGTAPRGPDPDADLAASVALATSVKDLDEHEYAVQSVVTALRPHTAVLATSDQPFTLKLPNLWHLATDVEGRLDDGSSALDLVALLHPTAAVAGTPTEAARALIGRLEPFSRGRYAGPVGWVDAAGDGEWAIALRCAHIGPRTNGTAPITAYAGAGIVAGSDPESELLETRVKFRPIVDALA